VLHRRFSLGRRFKRGVKSALGFVRRAVLTTLGSEGEVLLLCNDPAGAKGLELGSRLDFYLNAASAPKERVGVRLATTCTATELLAARVVAIGDRGLVPSWILRVFDHVFDVDFETNPRDGWEFARLATMVAGNRTAAGTARDAVRFRDLVGRLRRSGKTRAYLLGTGPSLSLAKDVSFTDGIVVACNTIVRDRDLWEHVRADVLVAGDAIYHFGHTAHARAFRADAVARLQEGGGRTVFIYPDIFDAVVRSEFRGLESSLMPIPYGKHEDVTVDLSRHFVLPDLGNVLNLLLLPVGASLSRDIWLWGFDGRAPDAALFWANSSKHSYPELMPALQAAHPAFFRKFVPAGRESEYVRSVHGDDLEEQLSHAEQRGFRFTMMHFSWTPTLNKRTRDLMAKRVGGESVG
jgi:hypothetical protein